MNSLLIPLMTLLPTPVLAAPAADIVSRIEHSYDPQVESRVNSWGFSFYGCLTEDIEIIGQDPINFQKRKVNITRYLARGQNKNPGTVIILPPTGGVNILDRGYANELCWAGMNVALISGWDHQEPKSIDFGIHDQGALRALAAVRHVVEFLEKDNASSIALLGTSIGAIAGNLVLGYEPRLSSAALIVGSGRFADVVAESTEKGALALREQRMKHLGIKDLEEYRKVVHQYVKTDPTSFVNYSGAKKTLLVTADADITVPTAYQYELVELLKPEVHVKMKGDHFQVIKAAFFQKRHTIVDFFRRSFTALH